jgi:hypothetical protein
MASAAPNPIAINAQQRAAVLGMGQKMTQLIRTVSVNPANENIVNIPPRNVGLILGFIVEVSGGVTNGAATVANRTGFGSANILKRVTFTDLQNVQRVQTSGRHLALLNSARQGFAFGGAYAPNLPMGYGNNWSPFAAPATIAADADATVRHTYWVPLAYSSADLRGSVYAGIVNATMQLQLDINQNPFVGATDALDAVYSGNANGAWDGDVTINVYQVYIDQIPTMNGAPVLPLLDLNTIYDIKETALTGMAEGQDFPVAYANFRAFLSTFAIYDNGGQFNSGSDINYWSLVSANSTQLFKYSPNIAALLARQTFMADPPPACYYFDHRDKPLDTITYGNLELNLNAIDVQANAKLIMGFEAFQSVTQIPNASSLAAGG